MKLKEFRKEIQEQLEGLHEGYDGSQRPTKFMTIGYPVVVEDSKSRCSFGVVTALDTPDTYLVENYYDTFSDTEPNYVQQLGGMSRIQVTVELNPEIAQRIKMCKEFKSLENCRTKLLTARDIYEFAMDTRHGEFPLHHYTLLYMAIDSLDD